jgi:exodeoxyribonuclease VII large subunit
LVRDANEAPLTSAAALSPGMNVALQFHDGHVGATIDGGEPARKATAKPTKPTQGSLL